MSEHIRLDTAAPGVLSITLDRPDRKNALTTAMYDGLRAALEGADADRNVRVIVLSGSGGNFTSGNDLADFQRAGTDGGEGGVETSAGIRFLQTISTARKPVLAAIEGFAIGIGSTMLLHCDGVYAADSARFRLPFVNLALCPEGGSTFLLPRMAGYKEAARLLMFGDEFDAETARAAGVVSEIVPAGEALARALERASVLAQKPPQALQLTKAMLKRRDAAVLAETLKYEGEQFARRRVSPEAQEAFAAFFEKRAADFSRFE